MLEVVKLKYARGESGWAVKDPSGDYPRYIPFKSETKAAAYAAEANSVEGKPLEPIKVRVAWNDGAEMIEYGFRSHAQQAEFLDGIHYGVNYHSYRIIPSGLVEPEDESNVISFNDAPGMPHWNEEAAEEESTAA